MSTSSSTTSLEKDQQEKKTAIPLEKENGEIEKNKKSEIQKQEKEKAPKKERDTIKHHEKIETIKFTAIASKERGKLDQYEKKLVE